MLLKFIFLFAALKLHDVKMEPMAPTLLYCIPLIFIALFSDISFLSLLVGGIIMFCVSFIYFGLLTKFNKGVEYLAVMGLGGVFLVLFV